MLGVNLRNAQGVRGSRLAHQKAMTLAKRAVRRQRGFCVGRKHDNLITDMFRSLHSTLISNGFTVWSEGIHWVEAFLKATTPSISLPMFRPYWEQKFHMIQSMSVTLTS